MKKNRVPRVHPTSAELFEILKGSQYDFRYNVIRNIEQYKELPRAESKDLVFELRKLTSRLRTLKETGEDEANEWHDLNDGKMLYFVHQVATDRYNENIIREISELHQPKKMEAVIREGSFRAQYDAFKDYFEIAGKLFTSHPVSEMDKFFSIFTVEDSQRGFLRRALSSWMYGVISLIMRPDLKYQNHMLILVGPQGSGKTTFFRNLFKDFGSRHIEERVPFKGDTEQSRSLSRNILWLLDDVRFSENERYMDFLKSLVTAGDSSKRLAYGHRETDQKRRASFGATTNRTAFLNDTTGDRRFLCLQVEKIDSDSLLKNINVKKLWGELYVNFMKEDFEMPNISAEQELNNERFRGEDSISEALDLCLERTGNPCHHVVLSQLAEYLYKKDVIKDTQRHSKNMVINAIADGKLSEKQRYLVLDRDGKTQIWKVGFKGVKWREETRQWTYIDGYHNYEFPKSVLKVDM